MFKIVLQGVLYIAMTFTMTIDERSERSAHVGLGTCFVCVQEVTFSNCLQNTTMCQPNEVCFTSENVDKNGTVRYNAGCLSEQTCRMVTGQDIETTTAPMEMGNLIGRKRNIPSNCFTCCSTDAGANRPCNDHRCPTGLVAQSNCIENGNCRQYADFICSPSNPSGMDICPITCKKPSCIAATCASRMDCNQQNTHATFLTFTMPCPVDHIDCVNNKCFCSIEKITTTPKPTTTTAAPSIACHQCGDPDANLPCDLRTVYMGQPSQCLTGSYCMTDVVQGSDGSVAIYKRCVDELTCRNEWMAQSSDQNRCLQYGKGAVPGQYTCHYCCTVDGCNSKIVPEARTFYSTSSSINNRK